MANVLLHYWKPETAAYELERGGVLEHIVSEQFTPRKVHPGDTIWIVTVKDSALLLLGRMVVGEVIEGRDAAIARLGHDDLWEATYTVIAQPDTAEPLNPVNIAEVAEHLVFQSNEAPRLKIGDRHIIAQQLQSTRLLTAESADLLAECWKTAEDGDIED